MDMKPENSYKFKKRYDATLYRDRRGRDKKWLAEIFEKSSGHKSHNEKSQRLIGKHESVITWYGLSEKEFQQLTHELSEIDATLEFCEHRIYISS